MLKQAVSQRLTARATKNGLRRAQAALEHPPTPVKGDTTIELRQWIQEQT